MSKAVVVLLLGRTELASRIKPLDSAGGNRKAPNMPDA